MPKLMLVIDPLTYTTEERLFAEPLKIREGMYYLAQGNDNQEKNGMTIAAYVFPLSSKAKIEEWFGIVKRKEEEFKELQAHFFYKILPPLRTEVENGF
jgi:hypothetical protein